MQCRYCREWAYGKTITKQVRECPHEGNKRGTSNICERFVPTIAWWCERHNCRVTTNICAAKRKLFKCACEVGDFII